VLSSKRVLVQQVVQAAVEGRVLQTVLCDEDEDALQRQHASHATCVREQSRAEHNKVAIYVEL